MSKSVKGSVLHVNLPPILGIFLTVFIDLLGFGLFFPDIQLRGRELGASGAVLGLTLGAFSLAQLVTAPLLGRVSDTYGRRRVLLITTALSCIAYLVYAHATSIAWIVASRVLSGVAAANVGVAFAYIADVTTPENRAKGMGAVGAAFGAGFVLGPGIGAVLLAAGGNKPLLLGYVAAGLCVINFLYVLLLLPESAQHRAEAGGHYLENFAKAFRSPGLWVMLLMFFTANLGFTNLESTYFQLLAAPNGIYHLKEAGHPWYENARSVGAVILTLVGIVSVFMQGYLVRKVSPKYGEVRLLRVAYLFMAPALAATPFLPLWVPAVLGVIALGVCTGLAQPSLSSLISRTAPSDMQGGIFGVTQSLGAIARFLGPVVSNFLFIREPYYPYLLGGALLVFPAILAWKLRQPKSDIEYRPAAAES